jgi:hypothetical protein
MIADMTPPRYKRRIRFSLRAVGISLLFASLLLAWVRFRLQRTHDLNALEAAIGASSPHLERETTFLGLGAPWYYRSSSLASFLLVEELVGVQLEKPLPDGTSEYTLSVLKSSAGIKLDGFSTQITKQTIARHVGSSADYLAIHFSPIANDVLQGLPNAQRVTSVDIALCGPLGRSSLDAIATFPNLKHLRMESHASDALQMPPLACGNNLQSIDIRFLPEDETSFGDWATEEPIPIATAKHFGFLEGCHHLESLSVHSPVDDAAVVYLTSRLPALTAIHLADSELDETSITAISSVHNLQTVTLHRCQLSSAA